MSGLNEAQMFTLFRNLWSDLHQPDIIWQLAALCLSLGAGWWLSRRVRQHDQHEAHPDRSAMQIFRAGSIKRLAFPLLSLLLVVFSERILKNWGHVSLLELAVPLLASLALVRATIYVLRRAFAPSGWLATSERFVVMTIWLCVVVYLTGLSDSLIDLLEQISFRVGRQKLDLWIVLHGVATVLATLLVALWIAGLIEARLMALSATSQVDSNLRALLARLSKALLLVVALFLSLSLIGIDITALSVFGGALAVGLGFGLQKIASNYVSGFIILLDRSIRIGNVISIDAATSGVVTRITTRYTVVRTAAGAEVIIPNEHLVSSIVHNQSYTDTRVCLVLPVLVAYGADVEQALRLMEEIAGAQPRVLSNPAPKALLKTFMEKGMTLEIAFWIADPQESTATLCSEINLAMWRAFQTNGIDMRCV